jgi:hypothetical protein
MYRVNKSLKLNLMGPLYIRKILRTQTCGTGFTLELEMEEQVNKKRLLNFFWVK